MPGIGQSGHTAKIPDRVGNTDVVSGDDDGVHARRLGRPAVDVLDHRPAGDVDQRLARQTRRVVSSGDDGDDSGRGKRAVEGIAESDRVHGES